MWDENALQCLVGDNLATQDRVLEKYLLTAVAMVEAIRKAAIAEQATVITELAHKLKSSSRAVGAMQLGSLCEALEHAESESICLKLAALVIQGFAEAQARIQARQR